MEPTEAESIVPTDNARAEAARRVRQWNEEVRDSRERRVADALMATAAIGSERLDTFSGWALAGTAATGAYWVAQADAILPTVGEGGYSGCGALLLVSILGGAAAKARHFMCTMHTAATKEGARVMEQHMDEHAEVLGRIKEMADWAGVRVDPGLRMQEIYEQVVAVAPWFLRWEMRRTIRRSIGKRPFAATFRHFRYQGIWTALQNLAFVGFLAIGLVATVLRL